MKPKHIVALVVALLFIGLGAFALVDSKIDYSDFEKAKLDGRRAQVAGTYVREKGASYDIKSHTFSFTMRDDKGVELPVSSGYKVRVWLHDNDTYTVQRVLVRGEKETVKGEERDIHAPELGEAAYQAGMYKSNSFGGHNP